MTKIPPSLLTDNEKSKKFSTGYTIKDLTQKNADIKKIFKEICPDKF